MCWGSGTRCFVNLVEEEEEEVGIQCSFLSSKNFHLKKKKGTFYHKFSDCWEERFCQIFQEKKKLEKN